MARALWSGSISFGLVNIPVRLYPATDSHQLELHQYDSRTHRRIRYKRVAEGTEREIPYEQIVDGYEVKKGTIVTLTDEEMAAAAPKQSHTLDLEAFVPLDAIDPIAWNHTYYVGPDGKAAEKAYAVLRDAMNHMQKVGVGRFVMRSKQYLATLRPFQKGLAVETMFFRDEIRDLTDVPGVGVKATVSARELGLAKQLIEALADDWHHDKFEDSYRDQLLALIKQKAKGKTIEVEAPETEGAPVIDLMEALKRSLSGGGEQRTTTSRGSASRKRNRGSATTSARGQARGKKRAA